MSNPQDIRQNNQDRPGRGIPKEDRLIHHMYQLSTIDKDRARSLFRECQTKGFALDKIPPVFAMRLKLNISYGFVKNLYHMQYEDDRKWFLTLAEDQYAYMGVYRLAIDKLSQLEKEMWLIIMNPKVEMATRIMATKELHSIIKSGVLLMRELPWITNLSKLYDLGTDSLPTEQRKALEKLRQSKSPMDSNTGYQPDRAHFLKQNTFNGINSSLVHNIMDRLKDNTKVREEVLKEETEKKGKPQVDADVMSVMQEQLKSLGYDEDEDVRKHKAEIRQSIEDKYINRNLDKIDKELGGVESEDEARVVKMMHDYRKTMDYLDALIPKEHRDAIDRLREISDSEQ